MTRDYKYIFEVGDTCWVQLGEGLPCQVTVTERQENPNWKLPSERLRDDPYFCRFQYVYKLCPLGGKENKWFTHGDNLFERDHLIEINKMALEMTTKMSDKEQVAFLKRRLKKLGAT